MITPERAMVVAREVLEGTLEQMADGEIQPPVDSREVYTFAIRAEVEDDPEAPAQGLLFLAVLEDRGVAEELEELLERLKERL